MHGVRWNLPDTEKTKNMVDTVGIKVFRHFLKAFHPPAVTVLLHYIPVICRKSPVLTVHGEIIRWCAGLAVHIEIVGFGPCLDTATANTDWYVSF